MRRFAEDRRLPYARAALFDLVADVESYPSFLPGVTHVHVLRRVGERVEVSMTVGRGPLRETFLSHAVLDRPHRIEIASAGPRISRFDQEWTFATSGDGDTRVGYRAQIELRSRLVGAVLEPLIGPFIDDIVTAFVRHAHLKLANAAN